MSDYTAAVELRDQKEDAANDRLPENGDRAVGVEQKLDLGDAPRLPAHTMTMMKAKRKDDGPLEIVCKWIVEYQVGMSFRCLSSPGR